MRRALLQLSRYGLIGPLSLGCIFVLSSAWLTDAVSIPLALVGCCISYASYTLDQVADVDRFSDDLRSERVGAAGKSRISRASALLAFAVSVLVTAYAAGVAALAMLLVFPLAVAMHGTPLLGVLTRDALGYRRIKDVPYAKAFHTASILALIAPFCALFLDVHEPRLTALLFVWFFLRCFSNTVACDYKDLERDRAEGVQTIPMALGIARTTAMLLIVDFVCIALAIAGIGWGGWPPWTAALALAVLGSSVALVHLTCTWREHEFICNVVLDSEFALSLLFASLLWS